jgi:hypothetical protein
VLKNAAQNFARSSGVGVRGRKRDMGVKGEDFEESPRSRGLLEEKDMEERVVAGGGGGRPPQLGP